MQISQTFVKCSIVAMLAATLSIRAADTETEARMREALRQKLSESSPAAPAEQPSPAKPVEAPKPAPAPKKPAPVAQPAPVKPAPAPTPAPKPVVAKPVEKAVINSTPVAATTPPPAAPVAIDDAQAERLREALRARMQQEAASPVAPIETAPQASKVETPAAAANVQAPETQQAAPTETKAPAKGRITFEAPASPVAGSKEQRLQQLLQQYKADQITPEKYHQERAKIIAE